MNSNFISQYYYLIKSHKNKSTYDSALQALISCSTAEIKGNVEHYVRHAIKNAIKSDHRKSKRPTTMQNPEPIKKYKNRKLAYVDFVNVWLADHHLKHTFQNQRLIDEAWAELETVPAQPIEISLDEPIYANASLSIGETLAACTPNPLEIYEGKESLLRLQSLKGIKDDRLRKYLLSFVPAEISVGSPEIRLCYLRALLLLIVNIDGWKNKYLICDFNIICNLIGIPLKYIITMRRRQAQRSLIRINRLKKRS